jgi:hypothetical protein
MKKSTPILVAALLALSSAHQAWARKKPGVAASPTPTAASTPGQYCGAAGCVSGSETWTENQGGGAKPCDTTTLQPGFENQVSSDNAGGYSPLPWNYLVNGYLDLRNPNTTPVDFTITGYIGQGAGDAPYSSPTYTLQPGETRQVAFRTRAWLVPGNEYLGFWIMATPVQGPLDCLDTNYDTEEHSNP